ncbi:MAG: phosphoesterase [Planctomycetes bacterium]|nr:phosphoesterase [Planctomycetota bacterium]
MIAFISDLHSNLEALEAVCADLDALGIQDVVCLGDVIGYGASPREVCEIAMKRCAITLQGNHDAALLDDRDARGFHERALQAIDWTRRALDPELEAHWAIWDWLGELRPEMELEPAGMEPVHIVHASPCEPLAEYLMPNLPGDHKRVKANFEKALHRLTFYGHTHHPGWFAEGDAFQRAEGHDAVLELEPDRRYLINVGSVGQPRDSDKRLAYALFDGKSVRWRRLDYDVETASAKIAAIPELPETLSSRLLVGK